MNGDDATRSDNEPTHESGNADEPAATVQRFIGELLERYRALHDAGTLAAPPASTSDERLAELLLAEAALRYADPAAPPRPPQVAVLGPTQTGKSTVVNLTLGVPVAEVSPLAGFTTHPHGFWIGAGLHPLQTGATAQSLEASATGEAGATGGLDESWTAELHPGRPAPRRNRAAGPETLITPGPVFFGGAGHRRRVKDSHGANRHHSALFSN